MDVRGRTQRRLAARPDDEARRVFVVPFDGCDVAQAEYAALRLHRDADAHGAAINRHFAEELVLVGQARRQFCLPEARAFRAEAQPVAIEVIAVRDSEPHLDVAGVRDAR